MFVICNDCKKMINPAGGVMLAIGEIMSKSPAWARIAAWNLVDKDGCMADAPWEYEYLDAFIIFIEINKELARREELENKTINRLRQRNIKYGQGGK